MEDEVEQEEVEEVENDFNPEEEYAEDETEEVQQEVEDEPESPAPVAPSFDVNSDPDLALLTETLGPDVVAAMNRVLARSAEAASLASIHVTTFAAENPELARVYGARIHQAVSRLDPSLRARPEAVNVAVASLLIEEANTKGLGPTLAKLASMTGKGSASPRKSNTVTDKAPIPAAQRPPSPGSGRQSTPETPRSGREGRIQHYMAEYGLDRGAAEQLIMSGRA